MTSSGPGEPGEQPPYGEPVYGQSYGQSGYGQQYGGYGQPPYGAPQPPGYPPYQPPPNEGLALPSMIIGIVALALMCAYGVPLLGAPVAMVMGRVSMRRIDAANGALGGRGMAKAGFILGIIGTVLLVLAIIAVALLIVGAVNGTFDTTYDDPTPTRVS